MKRTPLRRTTGLDQSKGLRLAAEEAGVTTYYKATRPDGTSFYDGSTTWRVGRITRVRGDKGTGLCGPGILHASDAPGETLVGGSWPCRLFLVEERSPIVAQDGHKVGAHAWKVEAELPAWQALGPNGEQVVALIERFRTLTADEARKLAAAWAAAWGAAWAAAWAAARGAAWAAARGAAWDAAWDAAWAAAWDAAWDAAWAAAWDAARAAARAAAWDAARAAARDAARAAARAAASGAALALVVRDVLPKKHFDVLYGPWATVIGDVA